MELEIQNLVEKYINITEPKLVRARNLIIEDIKNLQTNVNSHQEKIERLQNKIDKCQNKIGNLQLLCKRKPTQEDIKATNKESYFDDIVIISKEECTNFFKRVYNDIKKIRGKYLRIHNEPYIIIDYDRNELHKSHKMETVGIHKEMRNIDGRTYLFMDKYSSDLNLITRFNFLATKTVGTFNIEDDNNYIDYVKQCINESDSHRSHCRLIFDLNYFYDTNDYLFEIWILKRWGLAKDLRAIVHRHLRGYFVTHEVDRVT